ncbi:MAG: hypothetical protein OXC10_06680 [Rhodospirillaceae bacterium]|nr:hypothetical protein [Rhodospirillaceae bacterium]
MTAYLESVAAALNVAYAEIRFDDPGTASGPAILVQELGPEGEPSLDGMIGQGTGFVVECRSPTPDGAATLAGDLLDRCRADGKLDSVIEEYDAPDSRSGQAGQYYARMVEVRLRLT